jgi:hypothetical protein
MSLRILISLTVLVSCASAQDGAERVSGTSAASADHEAAVGNSDPHRVDSDDLPSVTLECGSTSTEALSPAKGLAPFGPFDRFLAVVIPSSSAGTQTAYRVTLLSLYHPDDPQPIDQPDYSNREGELRYLNLHRDNNGNVVTECISSSAFGVTYPCASVGCEPEFTDWGALFNDDLPVLVSGNAIVPDSEYTVVHLAPSCIGNAAACTDTSGEVWFRTARYGDTNPLIGFDIVNITDVVNTIDTVRQTVGLSWEFAVYIRNPNPVPHLEDTNVTDVVLHIDAVKLQSYPLPVYGCP